MSGHAETCPYCGEPKDAHAFVSPTTCVLASEVPDPPSMSGHADRYSQADREKDTMTPSKQALHMSGNAATIRTTLGTQGQWNAQAHAALDALLAENERLLADSLIARDQVAALLAENQRYEKALKRIVPLPTRGTSIVAAPEIAREALAGDTE